jgi:hypothetical protein
MSFHKSKVSPAGTQKEKVKDAKTEPKKGKMELGQ